MPLVTGAAKECYLRRFFRSGWVVCRLTRRSNAKQPTSIVTPIARRISTVIGAPSSGRLCLQPSGRSLGRARQASGPKVPRDFGECVNAGEERQIVRRDPSKHKASRLQPFCSVCQGHVEAVILTVRLSTEFGTEILPKPGTLKRARFRCVYPSR